LRPALGSESAQRDDRFHSRRSIGDARTTSTAILIGRLGGTLQSVLAARLRMPDESLTRRGEKKSPACAGLLGAAVLS